MDTWKEKLEAYWKVILILLLGIGVLVLILGSLLNKTEEKQDIDPYDLLLAEVKEEETANAETEIAEIVKETLPTTIMVDIKGAVESPGVYKMEEENRIIDAIERAGGLTQDAESKGVNFAQKVEDQMVIYIPKVGEEGGEIPLHTTNPKKEEGSLVNINEADANGLMTLNGIGASKADSILRYREEQGFFKTIEDIKNVSGIGDATFENLKDAITVSN